MEVGNRVLIIMNAVDGGDDQDEIDDRNRFVGTAARISKVYKGEPRYPYILEYEDREAAEKSADGGFDWCWAGEELLVISEDTEIRR